MAPTVSSKNHLVAQVVETDYGACAFCQRTVNDEIGYGKLYSIGKIYCHYFCVLLSCCLVQRGQDDEGLLGFLYKDILAEVDRSKKHKCSYCNREGATLGCSVNQCRKQFHLPCGREHKAVSMFYGNYKSFCEKHAPRQQIDSDVMLKAKLRMSADRKKSKARTATDVTIPGQAAESSGNVAQELDTVCVICYESVKGYPSTETFWPPCCARDAWFHRSCVERMALSAGVHYLKCPLCNDKNNFYKAVVSQGYYLPDRDAAWELEQNAFRDMYERDVSCRAEVCRCVHGRAHDEETGAWDIKLCLLCGGGGWHAACAPGPPGAPASAPGPPASAPVACPACLPAAPADLGALQARLAAVILQEESRPTQPRGPVMPSRMSLRRTKPRPLNLPATSKPTVIESNQRTDLKASRSELNLKSPRKQTKPIIDPNLSQSLENKLLSPIKMLDEKLYEKTGILDAERAKVVEMLRTRFKKPRPLSEKRKIVNAILNEILKEAPKPRSPLKQWNSPIKLESKDNNLIQSSPKLQLKFDIQDTTSHKENQHTPVKYIEEESNSTFELPPEFIAHSDESLTFDTPNKSKAIEIKKDSSLEISEDHSQINIDLIKGPETESRIKFSPMNKETVQKKLNIDMESFKSQYLNEVNKDFKCNFNHNHANSNPSSLYSSTIQFALNAAKGDEKAARRRLKRKERRIKRKKSKKDEKYVIEYKKRDSSVKIKLSYNSSPQKEPIDVTLESEMKRIRKKKKKMKKNLSISSKDVKVKIRWKEESSKKPKVSPEGLKQTVLRFSPENKAEVLKPGRGLKRKYERHEKSTDSLKQTSLHSFFKITSPVSNE